MSVIGLSSTACNLTGSPFKLLAIPPDYMKYHIHEEPFPVVEERDQGGGERGRVGGNTRDDTGPIILLYCVYLWIWNNESNHMYNWKWTNKKNMEKEKKIFPYPNPKISPSSEFPPLLQDLPSYNRHIKTKSHIPLFYCKFSESRSLWRSMAE